MTTANITLQQVKAEQANFMARVYGWMSLALVITGVVALWVASNPEMVNIILGNNFVFYGLLIGQLACVFYLSSVVQKISARSAVIIFLAYAALNGLTFSSVFLVFTSESIASAFLITAGTFGIMSVYGYFTKTDLTKIGNLGLMALIGLIIASVVNMFMHNETFYWITTYAGILIFVGLTAYDTQKIKEMNKIGNEGTESDKKEAIIGALSLYLDFINLFQYFLNIFGKRND
jgi:FtsH-binding integral membrane protein